MTRLDVFLKMFPNAELGCWGYPRVFPCKLDVGYEERCGRKHLTCGPECEAEFWNEEVQEEMTRLELYNKVCPDGLRLECGLPLQCSPCAVNKRWAIEYCMYSSNDDCCDNCNECYDKYWNKEVEL